MDKSECISIIEEEIENFDIFDSEHKRLSNGKNLCFFRSFQREFESFDKFLWNFINNRPIINDFFSIEEIPAKTEISEKLSKELKRRGMKFVGSTIMYAYMQAVGMVDDHILSCWKRAKSY